MTDRRKTQIMNISFVLIFLCIVVGLIWKARYSFGSHDESFYLTIPKRLLQGDALLVDEWHVSQLSSLLILPIMKVYLALNPSSVGMILHFRLIYIAFHSICTVILYLRLKKYSSLGSFFGSLVFLIYAPFGISALSYNSMGIDFFALSTILLATRPQLDKRLQRIIYNALIGLLFSAAVLCQPYLAALYLIYAFVIFIYTVYRKHRNLNADSANELLSPKHLLEISVGVAMAVVLFAVFVLSRASVSQIVDAIPLILSDPEHPSFTVLEAVIEFINNAIPDKLSFCLYLVVATLSVLAMLDRRSELRRDIYFILASAATVIYAYNFSNSKLPNPLMLSINLLGIVSFFLLKKRPYRLLFAVFVPTVYYSFVMNITSNQKFYVISSVFSVASIVSAVFIAMFVYESYHTCDISVRSLLNRTVCSTFSCCLLLVMLALIRENCNFYESADTDKLTTKIETGLNAGIYTRWYAAEGVEKIMEDTSDLRSINDGKVLYFASETYLYLSDPKENASFSAWLSIRKPTGEFLMSAIESELIRLSRYYELNPDKCPDYIYVNVKTEGTIESIIRILQIEDCDLQTTKYGNTVIVIH